MKKVIFILLIIGGGSSNVFADDPHSQVVNNYYTSDTTDKYNVLCGTGISMGLSSSAVQFDMGAESLQWGLGYGKVNDCGAASAGLAKRLGDNRLLLNGALSIENNETAYSFGLSGRF